MTEYDRMVAAAQLYQCQKIEHIPPTNHVELRHQDGSRFSWTSAIAIEYYDERHTDWGACTTPGEYYFIFTEHHGIHVYPKDDVEWIRIWQVAKALNPEFHHTHPGACHCLKCGHTAVETRPQRACLACGSKDLERIP